MVEFANAKIDRLGGYQFVAMTGIRNLEMDEVTNSDWLDLVSSAETRELEAIKKFEEFVDLAVLLMEKYSKADTEKLLTLWADSGLCCKTCYSAFECECCHV